MADKNKIQPKVEEQKEDPKVTAEVEEPKKKDTTTSTTKVEEQKEDPKVTSTDDSTKEKTEEKVQKLDFETKPEEKKENEFTYSKADELLVQYINKYLDVLKKNNINRSIKALVAVFTHVFNKPTKGNLDALYSFFNNEPFRSNILVENKVFQGISTLGIRERSRVEVMYTLMRELTTTKRPLSLDRARDYLGDDIVTWFAKKRKA